MTAATKQAVTFWFSPWVPNLHTGVWGAQERVRYFEHHQREWSVPFDEERLMAALAEYAADVRGLGGNAVLGFSIDVHVDRGAFAAFGSPCWVPEGAAPSPAPEQGFELPWS